MNESSIEHPQWQLKPLQIQDLGPVIDIPAQGLSLGRDDSNDLVLSSERFPHVSSHHARLTCDDGKLAIEDLGSKNGTLVNGKRIDAQVFLQRGDAIQLGQLGPRFIATVAGAGDETVTLDIPADQLQNDSVSLSGTKIVRMKRAIGLPEDSDIGTVLKSRSRKQFVIAAILVIFVVAAGIYGFMQLREESDQIRRDSEEEVAELRRLGESVRRGLSERIQQAQDKLDERTRNWEAEKKTLELARASLQEQINKVEQDERTSSSEIQSLQAQLTQTTKELERLDPITLEGEKLRGISAAKDAIVLIEMTLTFLNDDGKPLYVYEDTSSGQVLPTFEEKGRLLSNEATGSGFCVSEDGWIITNAHVVAPEDSKESWEVEEGVTLDPHVGLKVVFSDSDVRHPAKVIKVVDDGDKDLALIKIEPFEGMPVLPNFDIIDEPPEPLSEVFILGFPLGKSVIQEGDRVIASTFKGILSRVVRPYYQVDAGVHPGNSGGPLLDQAGRVIGVVTAVQGSPEGSVATIGYAIPIVQAKDIWPPPAM